VIDVIAFRRVTVNGAVGKPDVSAYLGWTYTQALFSGDGSVTAPTAPGRYELRLMRDESFVTLATAPLEVVK